MKPKPTVDRPPEPIAKPELCYEKKCSSFTTVKGADPSHAGSEEFLKAHSPYVKDLNPGESVTINSYALLTNAYECVTGSMTAFVDPDSNVEEITKENNFSAPILFTNPYYKQYKLGNGEWSSPK